MLRGRYKMTFIRFEFDHDKALQVINYLYRKLKNIGEKLEVYNLIKLLYLADEYHIERYGRLICGGDYVTMDYGHVHSNIYSLVNTDKREIVREGNNVRTDVPLDLDEFSESDIEALDTVVDKYGHYTFDQFKQLSHKRNNWKKNHQYKGTSNPLAIEDIIDSEEMKEYVRYWNKEQQRFENWLVNK